MSEQPEGSNSERLATKLRRRSPIRAWLADRQKKASTGAAANLLGALADPRSTDWKDRAVGYQTVSEIELSPEERHRAIQLLQHALTPTSKADILIPRLGRATATAVVGSITVWSALTLPIVSLAKHLYVSEYFTASDATTLGLWGCFLGALLSVSIATPFCFLRLSILARKRNAIVQQKASASLAQLGTADDKTAIPSPHSQDEIESRDAVQTSHFSPHPLVSKFERKLRKNSPIRVWLNRHRENPAAKSGDTLLNALENPNSSAWTDRIVGYHALRHIELTPPERTHASQLLLQSLATRKASDVVFSRLGASVILASILTFVFSSIVSVLYSRTDSFFFYFLLMPLEMIFTVPLSFAGLSALDRRRALHVQRAAVTALAQVGDPECIVTLTRYARHRNLLRQEAIQTLKTILPTVGESWYGRLPANANAALTDLALSSDEDLALAALDALGAAGSGAAKEIVEHISTDVRKSAPVRARATALLPILTIRLERETSAASLLRPSDRVSTEHLLHPVYGSAPEVANLLRASHVGSSEAADASGQ